MYHRTQSKPEAGDLKLIAQFEKDIKSFTSQLDQLRQKSTAIEDQIKALQEKILEVGGVKLRSQQTRVQDLKSQIDHSSDRLTKAEVGKAKSEKDATKLEKAIKANEESLAACEEEAEELNKLNSDGAKDSELVRRKVEEAQELLAEKTEELKEMKSRLDEQLEVMIQFRAREVSIWFFADGSILTRTSAARTQADAQGSEQAAGRFEACRRALESRIGSTEIERYRRVSFRPRLVTTSADDYVVTTRTNQWPKLQLPSTRMATRR